MVRIKHAVSTKKRKKKVLKSAKGQFGHRSKRYAQARRSVVKGLTYSYRDKKVKKREFRSLWIVRINAACREAGIPYSRFVKGLTDAEIVINRKMLSELALSSPAAFKKLVKVVKDSSATKTAKKPAKKEPVASK